MRVHLIASLLICLVQVTPGEGGPKASWDGDPRYDTTWVEFHRKVYALGGEVLDPSETLELLRILESKYEIRRDEESVSKYKRVRELLKIAEMNQEKCEKPSEIFESIAYEISCNHPYVNLMAFLNYYRNIQVENCKEMLNNKLQIDIELLPKSVVDSIRKFKESVLVANTDNQLKERAFIFASGDSIVNGVAHYLEHQLSPFVERVLEGRNGVGLYNREFNKLIREPCTMITVEKPISVKEYRLIARDREMLKKFDPFALEWLENYNLCLAIIHGGERNCGRTRDLSLSKLLKSVRPTTVERATKKEKGCFSCIRPPDKYTIS